MSIVKERIEYYNKQRQNRIEGKYNGLPIYKIFPRLGQHIPAIPKGTGVLITSNSGAGKSHSWLGLILYPMYKLMKQEPSFKIKFLIALLEDPEEMFIDRLFSCVLEDKFGIRVDPDNLGSFKTNPLSDKVINILNEVGEIVNDILSHCTVVDNIFNPFGLYKWIRSESNKYGKHHYKMKDFTKDDGTIYQEKVYSHYEYNDPNLNIVVITDNLQNLSEEMQDGIKTNTHQSIGNWCRKYGRLQILKHWGFIMINIIQQASDSEKPQFTYKGDSIVDKLKPSLSGLGDNKMIQRDHHIIIGLFAPDRFGITEYPEYAKHKYDICRLQDNIRIIISMKSNRGVANNKEVPMYFDGACSKFKELPLPQDMTETIYKNIENIRNS